MLALNVSANQGYSPDQVKATTLGELLEEIEEAIEEYGEDAEFVLRDANNRRGASYGVLVRDFGFLFEEIL